MVGQILPSSYVLEEKHALELDFEVARVEIDINSLP